MSMIFLVVFVIGAFVWALVSVHEQDKKRDRENKHRALLMEKDMEIQTLTQKLQDQERIDALEKKRDDDRRRNNFYMEKDNEDFIVLLKSAAYENKRDTIPNADLLEICNRARSIEDASSKTLDIEFSRVINTLLEEIKKRGLSYP